MVKCAECGLIGIRDDHGLIAEVEEKCRETGKPPADRVGCVLCCATPMMRFSWDQNETLTALRKERDCPDFAQWRPGFTPKEHTEMIQSKLLLDAQIQREERERQWRAEQAAEQRAWQDRQEQRQRQWHHDDMELAKQSVKKAHGNIVAALIVGGLLFLGTLLASIPNWLAWYYPRSAEPRTPPAASSQTSLKTADQNPN